MKRRATFTTLAVLALLAGLSLTAAGEEITITGWITDSYCGKNNAGVEGKACTLKCHEDGAKLVLFAKDKLWELDNQELAKEHVGHEVVVTGITDGSAIRVTKMAPTAKES
jgi:hypothetical protein